MRKIKSNVLSITQKLNPLFLIPVYFIMKDEVYLAVNLSFGSKYAANLKSLFSYHRSKVSSYINIYR